MKVVFTDAAIADLEEVRDFIANDNPTRATSFISELVDQCESLAAYPKAFPLVARYAERGVRRRVFRSYLIFYRVHQDRVEIVHVLSGHRNGDAVLADLDPP